MKKKIIDISSYQSPFTINYDTLAKEIDGVILRVGFTGWGTGKDCNKDNTFETHYRNLKKRGVQVGCYYYSCADTVEEAKNEAEFVYKNIKDKVFEYPIYFDTEDQHHQAKASKAQLTKVAKAFLEYLEDKGYFVGIYGSASWLNNQLIMNDLKDYSVWVAHYGVDKPNYSKPYDMHQYTSSGQLKGVVGKVDLNWCYKDFPKIIKEAGLNGYKKVSKQKKKVEIKRPPLIFKEVGKENDKNLYIYEKNGKKVTGWVEYSGYKYYFRPNGYLVYGGFYTINNDTFYFREKTGSMAIGWQKIKDEIYYFRPTGSMVTLWQKIGDKWHYFTEKGKYVFTAEKLEKKGINELNK